VPIFGSLSLICTIAGMDDREYWTKQLREAERELDAATRRSDVNAAAKRLQRAKGQLKRLDAEAAEAAV
jgi:hypothetical protein